MDSLILSVSFTLIFSLTLISLLWIVKTQNQLIQNQNKQLAHQSDLLASKDLSAFATIQQVANAAQEPEQLLSDDELALQEAQNRPGGLTEDERIYFGFKQLL